MIINPNTQIDFFPDLGISENDTLYFPSVESKNNYFNRLQKIASVTNYSYNRRERGVLKVQLPMVTAYKIGYMRYKNSSFENFWFYAFVDSVEYDNNETAIIRFHIDVMTTYMGVFELGQCFIERQHTVSDKIGENITDEGLGTGEYIIEQEHRTGFFNEYMISIVYLPQEGSENSGGYYNGLYSGCAIEQYESAELANAAIDSFVQNNQLDSIVAIYMLPTHYTAKWSESAVTGDTVMFDKPYTSIDGYVPRNKKLFCYPYKFLDVFNSEGESNQYMYEFFNTLPDAASSGKYSFLLYGVANANPQIICAPQSYKNDNGNAGANWEEQLSMSHFAQCAIAVDSYKAYLAQVNSTFLHDAAKTAATGAVMTAIGSDSQGADYGAKMLRDITSILVDNTVRPKSPATSKGSTVSDVGVAAKLKDFYFYEKCITKSYAKMIDSYFDSFGYAIRKVGTPNMNARPHWTYCKTIGCVVHGDLPADDARQIERMFDNGIRFWKNVDELGNYSLDNSPK